MVTLAMRCRRVRLLQSVGILVLGFFACDCSICRIFSTAQLPCLALAGELPCPF